MLLPVTSASQVFGAPTRACSSSAVPGKGTAVSGVGAIGARVPS